ncbi:hypothetical protein, partial [Aggregatibacter actinomycetemcomitans]|uniref:hypothetical protein n=1 Tax=Aggregatibacter actinomycetemcomitans TaxID=714 RepID=UPI001EE20F3A
MKAITEARSKSIDDIFIIAKKLVEFGGAFGNDGKVIAQHFRVIKSEKKPLTPLILQHRKF